MKRYYGCNFTCVTDVWVRVVFVGGNYMHVYIIFLLLNFEHEISETLYVGSGYFFLSSNCIIISDNRSAVVS